MIGGINSYSYYSTLFKNPIPSYNDPNASLIYGAGITALYSNKINQVATKEIGTLVKGLNNNLKDLKASASSLYNYSKNAVYNEKSVYSSDVSIVAGAAAAKADGNEHAIQIYNIATAQSNTSNTLKGNEFNSFNKGTNSFSISSNNKSYTFNIDIKSYDTNKDVLSKINNNINNAKIGITSKLYEDKDGNVSLSLTSDKTGTSSSFSIQDVNGSISKELQLNTVSSKAANASYAVDDTKYESESNNVKLNDNINLTLHKAGESKIKTESDTNKIRAAIHSFVDNVNSTVSLINNDHYVSSNAVNLKNNIIKSIKSDRYALASIGIKLDKDDKLVVDDEKLSAAVKTDLNKVKSAISRRTGIADKVSKIADTALQKPAFSYASFVPDVQNTSYISDMYNYMNTAQKQYLSKSLQQGLLFDQLL